MTSATRSRALEIVRDVLHDEMCPTPSAVDADRCQGECGRVTRDVVMKLANAKLLLISQEVPAEGGRRAVGQHDDANGMCRIADALGIEPTAPAERIVQGATAAITMAERVDYTEARDKAWALVDAAARDAGLVVPEVDTTPEHVARAAVRAITERAAVELLGNPATASAELEAWRIVARDAWAQMVARPDGGPGPESPQALAKLIGERMAEPGPLRAQLDTARAALADIYVETMAPASRTDADHRHGGRMLPGSIVSRVRATLDGLRSECTSSQASRIVLEAASLLCVHKDADASEVLPRVRELIAEVGTLRAANSALGDVAELVGLGRNDPPAAVLLAVQTGVTGQPSGRENEVLHEVARSVGLGDHPVLGEIAERVRDLRGEAHRNALCAGALDAVGRKLGLESDATLEAVVERTGKLVESLPSPGVVAELERLRDVVAVAQRERDAALAACPAQQMAAAHLGALTALVMAAHEWDPTAGGTVVRPEGFSRDELGRFDERVRTTAWLLARAHAVIEEGGAHVG